MALPRVRIGHLEDVDVIVVTQIQEVQSRHQICAIRVNDGKAYSFDDADLSSAVLTGASVHVADFYGTKYNDATKWPDGFCAEIAGAVKA